MSYLDTATTIAIMIVAAFMGMLVVWSIWPPELSPTQRDIVLVLVGALGSQLGTVTQYFFNRDRAP